MYKLREQRLKEFYTTGEMIQTETTSKRSSTRTHTESITDQGFMTMKTKEIRDSESPTEEYQRHTNINKNDYVSGKSDESDINRAIVQTELTSSIIPNEEYTQSSLQTSVSNSSSSKWESTQTIIAVSEEVQKSSDVQLNSKYIVNKQGNDNYQLTCDKSNSSNVDTKEIESVSTTHFDGIKREDNGQYSNVQEKVIETYTNTSNSDVYEPVSVNVSNTINNIEDNTYVSDISTKRTENFEVIADNKVVNELQKLDSYSSTQNSITDISTKLNSDVSNEEKVIKKVNDQSIDLSKEHNEGQYITTYQNAYQPPRISVDLSPSHEAFARSLRSTPERSSPSPNRERSSPERRFKSASPERRLKSVSPEKYRGSPEKSVSPPKSLTTRRKLSSTHTKDVSKKRANTPTRVEKYDSSDDSDCSGATHGTYDKYKNHDTKRTLFKEETKITSTSKYSHKSPTTSPVRREKSPGYSSEGSVGKEVRKSSYKLKSNSHESSPERSAFKPVKNYKAPQTQQVSQDSTKINIITQEENVYTNNYNTSINNKIDVNKFIKVIKPEDENIESNTRSILDSRNKSNIENFITEEQICSSSEQVDNTTITKEPINIIDINKKNREKSPTKRFTEENNTEEFIVNEKLNVTKENTEINDVVISKPKEKSPTKELKPEIKVINKTRPTVKSPEKKSSIPNNKSVVSPKTTTSTVTKTIPPSLEKTPSKISLINKDSKDSLSHKTVKKDLSKEKIEIKITRNDSKTLIHKNSRENVTPKPVVKKSSKELLINKNIKENVVPKTVIKKSSQELLINKSPKENVTSKVVSKKSSQELLINKSPKENVTPKLITKKTSQELLINKNQKENSTTKMVIKKPSQELLLDKKTTISFRNKLNNPENKPISQESIKVTEKKETINKFKPTISPQSSQKKLGVTKPNTEIKTNFDSKKSTENVNLKKIPSTIVTKPKSFTGTRSNVNEVPSKIIKTYSKTNSTSYTTRTQIKKTTPSKLNKTTKNEVTKNVEKRPKDLEDELPPNNFESDIDLDDSPTKSKYIKHNLSDSSVSSSSSEDENEEDTQKIKELDNIRIEAEEEYGKKMTNKDGLLNVIVQLPPSSRESSPEYSARFGQPYCSVSDDASLPRYADVVSEPEDVNDYRLNSNRYEIVTDLDEETNGTIADRVSKFLNSINKQEEIKTTEVQQSPQAVKKAKQLFESIAKGQVDEKDENEDENEPELINNEKNEVENSSKSINMQSSLLTRKISGTSDYKNRKDFFENKKFNDSVNSSSLKDKLYSFEVKTDKKTPSKDKINELSTISPESKNSSPDRTTKSPTRVIKSEIIDVQVEDVHKSRRLSGPKTVKDRTATFEKNGVTNKSVKENNSIRKHQTTSSPINTGRISEKYMKSVADTNSAPIKRVTSPIRNKKSPEKTTAIDSTNKVTENASKRVSSVSPDRKTKETPVINKVKSPERSLLVEEKQRTTINSKSEFGEVLKSTSAPKSTITTTKSTLVTNTDEELQIEEIFDLQALEIMVNIKPSCP